MNHLLNKDWEYVLHIYEEEMKGSTGWGLGEELAKLMVSQTCRMKPVWRQPRAQGPPWTAGSPGGTAPRFVRTGGLSDAFFFFFKRPHR